MVILIAILYGPAIRKVSRVSESLCQAYIAKHQLDIVIPRLCRTFGPTMLLSDSKASSQFILNAVHEEDIVLKSEGNQYFSYIYVGDAVSAMLHLLIHRSEWRSL